MKKVSVLFVAVAVLLTVAGFKFTASVFAGGPGDEISEEQKKPFYTTKDVVWKGFRSDSTKCGLPIWLAIPGNGKVTYWRGNSACAGGMGGEDDYPSEFALEDNQVVLVITGTHGLAKCTLMKDGKLLLKDRPGGNLAEDRVVTLTKGKK